MTVLILIAHLAMLAGAFTMWRLAVRRLRQIEALAIEGMRLQLEDSESREKDSRTWKA